MTGGSITVDDLADEMVSRGIAITRAAIRYHCRDPRGALFGKARLSGRTWLIPVDAAEAFAATYSPYGTLRKVAPAPPPGAGAKNALPDHTPPSEDADGPYPDVRA